MASPVVTGFPLPLPGAFDSHTHMDATGVDTDTLLDAAREAGIARVVNVGCDVASSRWSVRAADTHPEVYAAVAIHPNDLPVLAGGDDPLLCPPGDTPGPPAPDARPVRSKNTGRAEFASVDSPEGAGVLAEIERLAGEPRVVAVGETGLDYYWHDTPPEAQREWFRAHIEIARRVGKPVMIHDRDAHEDVLATLEEYAPWPPYSVIFHCFSGDGKIAAQCAESGYVMSFAGNVTFKNAEPLREAARVAPVELMLAETDAPYLTPVPHRGKPNHPALTVHTIRFLADLKNLDLADFCAQLRSTGEKVFRW